MANRYVRLHLRDEQVRAVRLVGHEAAAVERCARADAIRKRRRRAHGDRAAHAIAGRADLALLVDGGLAVEPGDERLRIGHVRVRRERAREVHERLARRRVLEVARFAGAVGAFFVR